MRRKLVQQGEFTLMVSLPKRWVDSYKLKKGSAVDIEDWEGSLLIFPSEIPKTKITSLRLGVVAESMLRTVIVNAYRSGYDRVLLSLENPKDMGTVINTLKNYVKGYKIVSSKNAVCTIEYGNAQENEDFDIYLRKVFQNVRQVIEGTIERFQNPRAFPDYEDVCLRVHQYDSGCRRMMVKTRIAGDLIQHYWSLLTLVVHAQRELYFLHREFVEGMTCDQKLLDGLKQAITLLEQGFFKRDLDDLATLHSLEKNLISHGYSSIKNGSYPICTYHILSSIRNIYLAASPAIGILMQQKK